MVDKEEYVFYNENDGGNNPLITVRDGGSHENAI